MNRLQLMVHATRFAGATSLVILFFAGCGTSHQPDEDPAPTGEKSISTGRELATFHVKEMSVRLKID